MKFVATWKYHGLNLCQIGPIIHAFLFVYMPAWEIWSIASRYFKIKPKYKLSQSKHAKIAIHWFGKN